MTGEWTRIADALGTHGTLARVSVARVRGSAPREVGAALVLRPDGAFWGTIGGGALEWRALDLARAALADPDAGFALHEIVLGPDLGQCCGGRVTLAVERLDAASLADARRVAAAEALGSGLVRARPVDGRLVRAVVAGDEDGPIGLAADGTLAERFGDERRPLVLFGAGHVGRALVLALAPLPFRVDWIDDRADAFPGAVPGNAVARRLADPLAALGEAPAGAFVLAVTHDHALDLAIVDAALRRPDLPYVGVVGSKTKRARFVSKLSEMGHTDGAIRRMVCPIGAGGPRSKRPAVIAATVVVELLEADEAARAVDVGTPRSVALMGGVRG